MNLKTPFSWLPIVFGFILLSAGKVDPAVEQKTLNGQSLKLAWTKNKEGWKLNKLMVKKGNQWVSMPSPNAAYTILFSEDKPDMAPAYIFNKDKSKISFPESQYEYVTKTWNDATNAVQLNTAGTAFHCYPTALKTLKDGSIKFSAATQVALIEANWKIDSKFSSDIIVQMTLTAKKDGYYAMASPSIATLTTSQLSWGMIPGYFQGATVVDDFVKSYAYGQGIPNKPVLVRERAASTLSPLLTAKNGITLAVIPIPGMDRDPWQTTQNTHNDWNLGLSLMNRKAELVPTIYHPVLGQKGSYLKAGATTTFSFRYTLMAKDWYPVYKHALQDIYRFNDFLALKQTAQSLTSRILAMHSYAINDMTSKWRTEQFNGSLIGAQAYNGGVAGSDHDAMKNSDYGAMYMLANIMNDTVLQHSRLPYVRNFKMAQQQTAPGFFEGAVAGQYYLSKSKRFVEEWGSYVEPIAITYYNLMDIGNTLLFDPNDAALKERFRIGADKLLKWQGTNGQWQIAYNKDTQQPMFTGLADLRPTFYGMLVAYRILKDKKYLTAACKGADWYIKNAVNKGYFLGVCGDTRFVPDFATGQSAQALLDLYDLTKNPTYKDAAIKTARYYTTSVYTHPIPNKSIKTVNGIQRQDWQISQVGLSFEHGGNVGSANVYGPILLASHSGLFVRMYQLTKDSIYLTMARAAALGRDAFVDQKTSVASYYWKAMNAGAGDYPHHAWWQIGWITDYIMAETEMRSAGEIKFPRGFITPKVGPHETYGFAPGAVYGNKASLTLNEGMLQTNNPYLDYTAAIDKTTHKIYFMLLNNDDETLKTTISLAADKILKDAKINHINWLTASGKTTIGSKSGKNIALVIPPYGLKVIEVSYSITKNKFLN